MPVLHIFLVLFTVNTHVPLKIAEEVDMVHKGVFKGGAGAQQPLDQWNLWIPGGFQPPTGAMDKFPITSQTVQYNF